MNPITLRSCTAEGIPLEATFLPERGMNLISYRRGNTEVIDQSTRPLFEERSAGLGALIGPHFHHRNPRTLPPIADESLFPHIARIRAKGIQEPFSHGVARYAPWKATATATDVSATITGKDEWHGVPLAKLEGQNFKMTLNANLSPRGLHIKLSIVSDTDSVVGIHYYYALPQGKGSVKSDIQDTYRVQGEVQPVPHNWTVDDQRRLTFDLSHEADYGFQPFIDRCGTTISLDAGTYRLQTTYRCVCEENSWQLYHPKGASFVCIEPLSAANPRKPCLSVSNLDILLEIQ